MAEVLYAAPALERGLEILELLSEQSRPLTVAEIAAAAGKSKAEIYRSLATLEAHGFISLTDSGHIVLTDLLFELGLKHPPRRGLIDLAMPHMRRFAEETLQACYLAEIKQDKAVVVAHSESQSVATFTVRAGYACPSIVSSAARVIFAFQTPDAQKIWLAGLRETADRIAVRDFRNDATEVRENGFLVRNSPVTRGIVDLGVPIFKGRQPLATAAIMVPFLTTRYNPLDRDAVIEHLIDLGSRISSELW